MNEPERSMEPQNDSLDNKPATPVEPDRGSGWGSFALGTLVFTLGAAALLVLAAPIIWPVQPATRSQREEMERRMQEIDAAERESSASAPAAANQDATR